MFCILTFLSCDIVTLPLSLFVSFSLNFDHVCSLPEFVCSLFGHQSNASLFFRSSRVISQASAPKVSCSLVLALFQCFSVRFHTFHSILYFSNRSFDLESIFCVIFDCQAVMESECLKSVCWNGKGIVIIKQQQCRWYTGKSNCIVCSCSDKWHCTTGYLRVEK